MPKCNDNSAAGVVTISALDSASSESGFLQTDRGVPEVIMSSDFTLRRSLRAFGQVQDQCPLGTRGWCLQERMLSPAILHFGAEQIFWECRSYMGIPECDPRAGQYQPGGPFLGIRAQPIRPTSEPPFRLWYAAVEAFSKRNLTFGKDKFPAMAGIATRFRELSNGKTTYLAGLWREDLESGIMWSAAYQHLAFAYGGERKHIISGCAALSRPSVLVAPSWSWASVDGQVHFYRGDATSSRGTKPVWDFRIVDINIPSGLDDLMAQQVIGSLAIKGLLAKVWYCPRTDEKGVPDSEKVGWISVSKDANLEKDRVQGAMLDFNRCSPRECWAMLAFSANGKSDVGFLLLDRQSQTYFTRVGFCSYANQHPSREGREAIEARMKEMVITLG